MSDGFFDKVCENFRDDKHKDLNIGYAHSSWPFILVPSLALFLNIFIIFTHIRKYIQSKSNKISIFRNLKLVQNQTSIEIMLYFLTIVETFTSLYWLLNGIFFYKVDVIYDNCVYAFFNSLFSIFIQSYDWLLFTCSLHNIMCFIQDPLKEKTFPTRLRLYLIASSVISGLFTFCVFLSSTYGLSPMLTCLIKNNYIDKSKNIRVYCIMLMPFIYLIYSLYSFIVVFRHRKIKANKDFKIAIFKYLIYSALYIVFYFPSIVLYIITTDREIEVNTFASWLSYFCSLGTISINLALCVFRILEGYVKCDWKAIMVHQSLDEPMVNDIDNNDHLYNDTNLELPASQRSISIDTIQNQHSNRLTLWGKFSVEMVAGYMRNLFIGLILCLNKSSELKTDKIPKCKSFTQELRYLFKSDSNNTNLPTNEIDYNILKIPKITDEDVYIEVIEYAPKIFKKLRQIEGITEEEIIDSLNPLNNSTIIQSQGKSSSFFISTDDSKLILKTLKREEFDNIFHNFLMFYYHYIENNSKSLICRIYGIYSVKASYDADPVLIIVLRNAKGPLEKFIKTTYDLKGSLQNREIFINEHNSNDPFLARKDINFLNEEKYLNVHGKEELLENCVKDSEFLEDLNLMDYSLLLLKLEFDDQTLSEFKSFKDTKTYSFYQRYIYFSSTIPYTAFICVIIDFLQDYSFLKKMENNLKNYITERPEKSDLISCVPADIYSKRFIEFVQKITKTENLISINIKSIN